MCRKMIYLVSFALVLSLVLTNIAGAANHGLVGWWKFDEGSGNNAFDSSGNENYGLLLGGPQWVAGKIDGALEFDGRNDYVDTDYTENLANWTIACWVISPDAPSGAMPSGPVHREKNYQINWNHGDTTFRGAAALNVGEIWYAASFGQLRANTWYHLAATYNRQVLKAYKNGAIITSSSAPSGNPSTEWGTLKFARHSIAPQYFSGTIDDVRIYNKALTLDEILDAYEGDMAPTPNVYHVDANATGNNDGSSWANAYVYLQDALADANDTQKPVEIHVAQGTYTPDRGIGYVRGDKGAKFLLKSGVTIKGGFAGADSEDPNAWDHQAYITVLSGDLSGNDERFLENFVENSDHVIWCIEGDASAVLDGFTITGGYATDRIGGGLLNYNASPTVKRCVFFDNYASQGGGMANRHSSPTVSECTFSGNLAPNGGGGMYNDYSHPFVEFCVFFDNWTWYLGGGGMYCGGDDPTITNCLFTGNGAPFGGGMYNAAANPSLINCTFTNNRSNSWGGGMQNDAGANPSVTNCILWGDTPDEISFPGTATVSYSNVQGGWEGIGNIDRDPKFADLEGRLSADSLCIDSGNNDAVPSDITTDLDGNPRIINGTVDMGAYEFGSSPTGPSADPLAEAMDTNLTFTTGGDADWYSQTAVSYHDGDAAKSGSITDDQASWLQTLVNGAGTVSFFWKVSSEENYDLLEFYVDGTRQDHISGAKDWHQTTYDITGSASHTLEWRYFKEGSMSSGDDCGWVDKVEWVAN
ncbi:MAG: hypothetical protein GY774_14850 [Planctomycetes bacterium]|nr:hypothetical protein [Planctomycetota bacterium]